VQAVPRASDSTNIEPGGLRQADDAARSSTPRSGQAATTPRSKAFPLADADSWQVTILAGSPTASGTVDGTGSSARFASPKGMSIDVQGNAYTVDNFCGTLRKITPAGEVTTLAGPAGSCVFGDADGTGTHARFNGPSGTTVDRTGNIYVADSGNCTLRKVTPPGTVTTVAGAPSVCVSKDGPRSAARFNHLAGVAVDQTGIVYVTSWNDCTVRAVRANGSVVTVAGASAVCATVDGGPRKARFNHPSGIALGPDGNFYIADETGCTIRKMTPEGFVSTIAGKPDQCGSADGTKASARFNVPSWTAVDYLGNVNVSDYLNLTIRKVTSAGVVTTLAGQTGVSGSTDGIGSSALFNHPDGIAVDVNGTVYVADRNNNIVRTMAFLP
jgi:sugar lactone lactonase YvrE